MSKSLVVLVVFLSLAVPGLSEATAVVGGWFVIDDSMTAGAAGRFTPFVPAYTVAAYDTTGDWASTGIYASGGTSGKVASWTFLDLPAGFYDVAASVSDLDNRATNAPYSIDGGAPILVNQQIPATGPPTLNDGSADIPFLVLQAAFPHAGGDLTINLTDTADGYVIADAIAIRPLPEASLSMLLLTGTAFLLLLEGARPRA